jgi:hypothetical protein
LTLPWYLPCNQQRTGSATQGLTQSSLCITLESQLLSCLSALGVALWVSGGVLLCWCRCTDATACELTVCAAYNITASDALVSRELQPVSVGVDKESGQAACHHVTVILCVADAAAVTTLGGIATLFAGTLMPCFRAAAVNFVQAASRSPSVSHLV